MYNETKIFKYTYDEEIVGGLIWPDLLNLFREIEMPVHISYYAARCGNIGLLKALKPYWSENTLRGAARYGNLDILKWLKHNKCPWDERTFRDAAFCANIDVLRWLKANNCPYNDYHVVRRGIYNAALNSNFNILNWVVKEMNCSKKDRVPFVIAIRYNNYHMLVWLKANGFTWSNAADIEKWASSNQKVLDWLRLNGI